MKKPKASKPSPTALDFLRTEANSPNALGWVRLIELLQAAANDPSVRQSNGASSWVALALVMVEDSIFSENGEDAFRLLDGFMPKGEIGVKHLEAQKSKSKLERKALILDGVRLKKLDIVEEAYKTAGQNSDTEQVFMNVFSILDSHGCSPIESGAKEQREIRGKDDQGRPLRLTYKGVQKMLSSLRAGGPAKRGRPTKKPP